MSNKMRIKSLSNIIACSMCQSSMVYVPSSMLQGGQEVKFEYCPALGPQPDSKLNFQFFFAQLTSVAPIHSECHDGLLLDIP